MMNAPEPSSTAPRRARCILMWSIAMLSISIALFAGTLLFTLTTEAGARAAWRLARTYARGHLSGVLEGGTLARGIRIQALHWQDGQTDLRIDRLNGRWMLTRAPLRLTVYFLDIGTVDVRAPATPKGEKTLRPDMLMLPLALDIQNVRLKRLRIHKGISVTEFNRLKLRAASDRQHHQIYLESFETPFGTLTAQALLNGQRPFILKGIARFTGAVQGETVHLDARVSGSLERWIAEIDASGLTLSAQARIEATPFAEVPFKTFTLTADHLNPHLFATAAPHADLSLHAQLAPLPNNDRKTPAGLTVAGSVSMMNAQPGPLHQQRLPLIDARAEVRLNAQNQTVPHLHIRLLQGAQIEGSASFKNKDSPWKGRFDLQARGLNLNVFTDALRQTKLSGPLTILFGQDTQCIKVDLSDTQAALRAQAEVRLDAAQIKLNAFKLQTSRGHAKVSGALQKDTHSSYQLKVALNGFEPWRLLQRPPQRPHTARIFGTLTAQGQRVPSFETQFTFALRDSVYASLPLTGAGTVHLAGTRLLPSQAKLSIAGNHLALQGSLGHPGDTLQFNIDAPQLGRIGFGLDGTLKAGGTVSGALTHPGMSAYYQAHTLTFQKHRIGQLEGHIEWREGPYSTVAFSADGQEIALPYLNLQTLHAQLSGARTHHTVTLNATGQLLEQPIDLQMAARGGLTETRAGMGWTGTLSQLNSHGLISTQLKTPIKIHASPDALTLGATQLTLENAQLDLHALEVQRGRIRSAGTLQGLDIHRVLKIQKTLTGEKPALKTTLIVDGQWDFTLSKVAATGSVQLTRRSGDIQLDQALLGLNVLSARLDLSKRQYASLSVDAQAARLGTLNIDASAPLSVIEGRPTLEDAAPLAGTISAEIQTLKNMGPLLGPQYLLDGRASLNLALSGSVGQPKLYGTLNGDDLSMTLIDEGVTLKNGVVRIAVQNNRADFQKVEFQGASGVLRASGSVALDRADTPLSVQIVADTLELFARPDRQLSISGRATLANRSTGGFAIEGAFTINRAFFNLPGSPAPRLGDDVIIMHTREQNGGAASVSSRARRSKNQAFANVHLLQTRIGIDLGQNFIFRGAGADLDLTGKITLSNAAGAPLRAHGDLRARRGSTYELLGTKLSIEKGYVTFNGPVDNPAIHILAMRRNQDVEVGVQIRGTTHQPRAQLISEPAAPDTEKLSWLLFGHGTDKGTNPGQQHAKSAALAFLGSMGGQKIAQSIGLDELSIGQSEAGLTDPQVIILAKALNRHLILGYEQGLTTGAHIFKMTWQFWRSWSIIAHAGTVNGVNLLFSRRFD